MMRDRFKGPIEQCLFRYTVAETLLWGLDLLKVSKNRTEKALFSDRPLADNHSICEGRGIHP